MPNSPATGSRNRSIRLPDELWDAAQKRAAEKGENVSDVIRRALRRYASAR